MPGMHVSKGEVSNLWHKITSENKVSTKGENPHAFRGCPKVVNHLWGGWKFIEKRAKMGGESGQVEQKKIDFFVGQDIDQKYSYLLLIFPSIISVKFEADDRSCGERNIAFFLRGIFYTAMLADIRRCEVAASGNLQWCLKSEYLMICFTQGMIPKALQRAQTAFKARANGSIAFTYNCGHLCLCLDGKRKQSHKSQPRHNLL